MEKERYIHYRAADFVLDDDFVAWVKSSNSQSDESWKQWLLTNPDKKVEVEAARRLLLSMSFKTEPVEQRTLDQEWQVVREAMAESTPASSGGTGKGTLWRLPVWGRLAAASVVLLVAVWLGRAYLPLSAVASSGQTEKRASNGQQLTVKLTDGTTIVLNAGSTLRYPEDFAPDSREVQLTGEAYFEVAPNPKAPFRIFTEDVRVQVIGTKFIVKAYPENKVVKVAVVEGKVAVNTSTTRQREGGAPQPDILLTRNEMVTIEKSKREALVSAYDVNDLLGWKNGVLYFEKADFNQFVGRLERWYGVQISVSNDVRMDSAWRFSGKFENKSIDYILDVCQYPNRFTYELTENKVFITK